MSHKRSHQEYSNSNNIPLGSGNSSKTQKTHHDSPSHRSNGSSHSNRNSKPFAPKTPSFQAKYPSTTAQPNIPPFKTSLTSKPTSLPTLPDLEPGRLSTAPFTHASKLDARYGADASLTYERLEFLGDAYLEIIATRIIYSHFPVLPIGRQAQLREKMIRNTTLAAFARGYKFGEKVEVAHQLPPDKYEKMLADVFEAYVAAVVLSWPEKGDGFGRAESWMTELWAEVLLGEGAQPEADPNRKDELVKLIGGKDTKIEYVDEAPKSDKNRGAVQQFEMGVYFTGWGQERVLLGKGVGVGKKEAGMRAASDAFESSKELIEKLGKKKRKADEKRRAEIAKAEEVKKEES